uniref:Uncharacterized protein n=1 Tax=Setaria italica TaxID=4555 RepID=K4A3U5_SETIT
MIMCSVKESHGKNRSSQVPLLAQIILLPQIILIIGFCLK